MRKTLSLVIFMGMVGAVSVRPARAQISSGHETVQDAVRFERQKQAAADRQARLEARQGGNSNADRAEAEATKSKTPAKHRSKGSAARTTQDEQKENKQ